MAASSPYDRFDPVTKQRGVPRIEATVLSSNNRILRILRHHHAKLGPPENGVVQATIGDPAPRRAAARR